MNNDLIDRSLAELQDLTHDQRTPERLLIWLSFICEAAGVELGLPVSIQYEQLKLEAAMVLLSKELALDRYTTSLRIPSVGNPSLCAFVYLDADLRHQAYGSGRTAAEVLEKLRADLPSIGKEAAAA